MIKLQVGTVTKTWTNVRCRRVATARRVRTLPGPISVSVYMATRATTVKTTPMTVHQVEDCWTSEPRVRPYLALEL